MDDEKHGVCEEQLKRLYEESRRSEERYRDLIRFLPIPVAVLSADQTVTDVNPAFEETFGWSKGELRGKRLPFVPEDQQQATLTGKRRLISKGVWNDFETKRLAKDGRILDVIYDGAVLYDERRNLAGMVITMRDVTQVKQTTRTNQLLFQIAQALHHYDRLDDLLAFITQQIKLLMDVDRAQVALLDEEKQEFFFQAGAVETPSTYRKYAETRIPIHKGVLGQVYRRKEPMIVADYARTPYALDEAYGFSENPTYNMLQVPLWIENKMIGVLCAANKKNGPFDQEDLERLGTIAGMVALPIANARINQELLNSYDDIKSLNSAKDRIIEHLSHELRTPLAVLSASLHLLSGRDAVKNDGGAMRLVARILRNLTRIADLECELNDIVTRPGACTRQALPQGFDACADLLESLLAAEVGEEAARRACNGIARHFSHREQSDEQIGLPRFLEERLDTLIPLFSHRRIELVRRLGEKMTIAMPPSVLATVVAGLVRNAVEYTPDGGQVTVALHAKQGTPVIVVEDTGIGITSENQRLLFNDYFTTGDIMGYATRNPFDFNAGGRGFDLLRMKRFSKRFGFELSLHSVRCRHIPTDADTCPGDTGQCQYLSRPEECRNSGGTRFTVHFLRGSVE